MKKLAFILFLLVSVSANATTRYWIGTTSSWNLASNWNTISGGGGSTGIPTSSDDVVFNGNGIGDCTIDVVAVCKSINVTSAYTGTITQTTFTLTVGSAVLAGNSATWAGGTFIGGSADITIFGTFLLNGTAFTSTTGNLKIGDDLTFASGVFTHNNGTLAFNLALLNKDITFTDNVGATLNNVSVGGSFSKTITFASSSAPVTPYNILHNLSFSAFAGILYANIASISNPISVNTLSLKGSQPLFINTGAINATGDITVTNTGLTGGGSGTLNITGSGTQTLTGSGTINQGNLPNVIINKSGGTLNLASYITCIGPLWTYIAGTINSGTSTICFYNTSTPFTVSGTHTLNNVVFYGNYSTFTVSNDLTTNALTLDATLRCDVTVSSSMTVNGTLTITGSGYYKLNSGTLNVKGDVTITNTNTTDGGGTSSFIINGTGSQTITGTAVPDQGALPPFTINKASGTLNLSGFITFYNGFMWIKGTVNSNPGTPLSPSTCVFYNAASSAQTISSGGTGMSFYNVLFEQSVFQPTKLLTDMIVLGTFTIADNSGVNTNSHNISIGGDFTNANTHATSGVPFVPGTGTVTFNGNGPQKITTGYTLSSTSNPATFGKLTINNTAGSATCDDITLVDILSVTNKITFTNGAMKTSSNSFLYLAAGATCALTGPSNSYVNGPMSYDAKAINSALNFPIGDGGSSWRYITLTLKHNNATTTYTYTAQITHSSAGALAYTLPATIERVSGARYTTVTRTTGGAPGFSTSAVSNSGLSGNQTITMYYDTDDQVGDYTNLTIAKTTGSGSPWTDIGGTATGNNSGTITSTSAPTAFTSFSKFSLANRVTGTNSLPIKLVYFNAKVNGKKVNLKWQTATETNNDHFELMRSKNGIEWEMLENNIKAAGNSTETHNYSFEDVSPFQGASYYRLRQFDFDGQFQNYTVSVEGASNSIVIYPNPSSTEVTIEGENLTWQDVLVTDQLGLDVTQYLKIINSTNDKLIVDISALSPQAYIFKIRSESTIIYKQ